MSIKVESLTKSFGKQKAVDSVSFAINKGEIAGFLGPNGSGKTTTMRCICGILRRDRGHIVISGIDIEEDLLGVKRIIGFLPENNPLHPEMYVKEYLMYVDGFYNRSTNRMKRVNDVIGLTGLSKEVHKKIGQLSKGYRQRVGLAQTIIHNPGVLILDEPTTGLDPNQIVEIRNLIQHLSKEKTVLLSTHILQEVEAICDRIIVINEGKIVADGPTGSIRIDNEGKQTIYLEFSSKVERDLLLRIKSVTKIEPLSEREFLIEGTSDHDLREEVFQFVTEHKLPLLTLQKKQETLEEAFRELTRSR
jgi:ABC-2 type transport system ATP-binding protein